MSVTLQLNTFDGNLRLMLNGYPENSIEQTKCSQSPPTKHLNLPTQNGHTLRSCTFLTNSITGSLTFLKKKTSLYSLPTNPILSDEPYPTPPRSANTLETNALSLTPECVYEEMQCTSSRVTAVIMQQYIGSTTCFITTM